MTKSTKESKVKRDAFLYLEPQDPKSEFAQCSTCQLFLPLSLRCGILGPDQEVFADSSCGLYIHGQPAEGQIVRTACSAEEAGLVHRQVRCENCLFFESSEGICGLFVKLNQMLPEEFDLETGVYSQACCNAQTPKSDSNEPADKIAEAKGLEVLAKRAKQPNRDLYKSDIKGAGSMNGTQAQTQMQMFIPLTKVDAVNRLVYGIATEERPDRAREIFDYVKSKPHYEQWSREISLATEGKSLGNVRAMHTKIAAGKLTELVFNDQAKRIEICAKIVDDNEWNKVQEGVYSGFSQGGEYVERYPDPTDPSLKRYVARPTEISLVDLPCLPTATFQLIKVGGPVPLVEVKGFQNIASEEGVADALEKLRTGEYEAEAIRKDNGGDRDSGTGDGGSSGASGADGDVRSAMLTDNEIRKLRENAAATAAAAAEAAAALAKHSPGRESGVAEDEKPKDGSMGVGSDRSGPKGSASTPNKPSIEDGGGDHPQTSQEDDTREENEDVTIGKPAQQGTKPGEHQPESHHTPSHIQETKKGTELDTPSAASVTAAQNALKAANAALDEAESGKSGADPASNTTTNTTNTANTTSTSNTAVTKDEGGVTEGDSGGPMQVWLAKDNTPFRKKADAYAHNEKLALEETQKAISAPAQLALDALRQTLDRIDMGGVAIKDAQSMDHAWQDYSKNKQARGGVLFGKVYSSIDEIPPAVKQHFKDENKQRQWMHVWNSVYKDSKDEQKAFAQAWAAAEKFKDGDTLFKASDNKKPYGDVTYADPGYQKDGKKRYPLDTEAHVRAAWSYIHMPRNAAKYSPDHLAAIRGKIAAAFKKVTGNEPPSTSKVVGVEFIKLLGGQMTKHLYDVGQVACTILQLNSLKESLEMEAIREGDSGQLAIDLEMNVAGLCEFLRNLVAEETAELVAGTEDLIGYEDDDEGTAVEIFVRSAVGPNASHLASVFDDAFGKMESESAERARALGLKYQKTKGTKIIEALEKVGRKMGQVNRMHLQEAHDHIAAMCNGACCEGDEAEKARKAGGKHSKTTMAKLQAAHDHMSDLGADCSMSKGALLRSTDDEIRSFEKGMGLTEGGLYKLAEENVALKKAFDALTVQITDVVGRIKKLEKQPEPAKGIKRVMPGARVIEKSQDGLTTQEIEFSHNGLQGEEALKAFQSYLDTLSTDERSLELIKAAQRNPKLMVNGGPGQNPWIGR